MLDLFYVIILLFYILFYSGQTVYIQVYIYKGCEALSKSSQVASKFFNCFVLTGEN